MNTAIRKAIIILGFLSLLGFFPARVFAQRPGRNAVGHIIRLSGGRGIAEPGDQVTVMLIKEVRLAKGMKLAVFKVREDLLDESGGDDEKEARVEETLGTLEVMKIVSPKKAVARVITILGHVELGNLVKLIRE